MRIAVAGGTGLVGRQTVKALRRSGHDAVVIARSVGVDPTTGDGLAAALLGVDAVVDVTNTPIVDPAEAREFNITPMKIRLERLGWMHLDQDNTPVSGPKPTSGQARLFGG